MQRNNRAGLFALVGLGLFYAYRNRYKIQEFLSSRGIETPIDTSTVGSRISSGVAKLRGALQREDIAENRERPREAIAEAVRRRVG